MARKATSIPHIEAANGSGCSHQRRPPLLTQVPRDAHAPKFRKAAIIMALSRAGAFDEGFGSMPVYDTRTESGGLFRTAGRLILGRLFAF